mmetsp:Transcript_35035/g.139101  ORF Transcript_35035/g.139101 Transcript_35035/m.139101 type:complete len:83 (-) Transcript_35035:3167-3415(-)
MMYLGASKTKRTREAFVRRNFGKKVWWRIFWVCLFDDFNSLRRSVSGASHAPNLFCGSSVDVMLGSVGMGGLLMVETSVSRR